MNMPGFTAEASLRASQRNRLVRVADPMSDGAGVVPQATAVPDWILEFWYATGGGGGGGLGGGGGGGGSPLECRASVEAALDACRRRCWFGTREYDPQRSRACEADCYAIFNPNNCPLVA